MQDYLELQKTYEFDVYTKRNAVLVRGENARVWDDKGNEYIDCVAGHGVASIGHANERISSALQEQSKRLITCSNLFYNDRRALLLEKLLQIVPRSLKRAFLCNSGTEAIEAAIKFARFTTKRTGFICAMHGFHGRTFGAMSATFKQEYRAEFEPVVPGFSHVPFNDFERLQDAITQTTAGVILEVVQGEGGIHVGTKDYFGQVRELCNKTGVLLIIDEIQSGFCRTGKMFACNHFDLQPDIMCVAKAIAGGLPMGAVVCAQHIEIPVGKHGTTFGGNPLSCAAAIAAIDFMLDNKLDERAKKLGSYFMEKVKAEELSSVREVRGLGLMIGIELNDKALPFVLQLMEEGVLVFPAGANVIRVFPPLTIEVELWERVVETIIKILA